MEGPTGDYLTGPGSRVRIELLDRRLVERLVGRRRCNRATIRISYALLSILMLEIWLASLLPRAMSQDAQTTVSRCVA